MSGAGETGGRETALLIAGPTASGKSALALAIAEAQGGVVVNADSMQVYADLPILSAQPTQSDRARAPHHLFGHVDGGEGYSVGRWLGEVARALAVARDAGRLAVVVGGTGLYFKALTQGLSAIPPVPEPVRTAVRAAAEGVPPAVLHERLAARDPASAARLRPSDPQRILRALEVFEATGRSLTAFQGERSPPLLPAGTMRAIALVPEPGLLKARIDARFAAMLEGGAISEVERLAARGLDPAQPVLRALGVPPLLAFLQGTLSREDAAAAAMRQSRAYARRQMTFLRHQLPGFQQLAPAEAAAVIGGRS